MASAERIAELKRQIADNNARIKAMQDKITDPANAKNIVELIKTNGSDWCYGIRSDDRVLAAGDELSNSYDWTDLTGNTQLDGTCATGMGYLWYDGEADDLDTVTRALATHAKKLYDGQHLYLISGDDCEDGDDEAEVIISNAKVVAAIF